MAGVIDSYTLEDVRRIERALSGPVDDEWELARAAQFRYARRGREILKLRAPTREGPGSMLFAQPTITLFASGAPGAALATFTTEAAMYAATQVNAWLMQGYFDPTYGTNKTLRLVVRGIYSTTATPTFTVGLRQDTVSGGIWGTSLAMTGASGVTNLVWEFECDITAQAPLLASAHNEVPLVTMGVIVGVGASPAGFTNGSAIGTQTPTTPFTLTQIDASHFLFPTVTCSLSSASNKWQMLQMLLMGLN